MKEKIETEEEEQSEDSDLLDWFLAIDACLA